MADPVRVVAILRCKPGKGDQAAIAARACVDETRREAGCLDYAASRSDDVPDRILFVERWESRAARETHKNTAHLAEAVTRPAALPLEILVLDEI